MAKKATLGAGLALDGEKEFKQAVREINADIRVLTSEMGKVTAEFDGNAKSVEGLTKKQSVLERQLYTEKDQIENLKKALQNSATQFGEANNRTKNWQTSLNKAETEMIKTQRELDKTTKELKDFENGVGDAEKKSSLLSDIFKGGFFANIASDALKAVASSLKEFASAAFEASNEINKVSLETGLSITKIQELEYVTTILDGSVGVLEKSQARLTRAMSEARDGTTEYLEAFQRLGWGVENFTNEDGSLKNASDVMFEMLDALGSVANEADRDAISLQLFGRSALELNPLIKAGADELNRLSQEAHTAGAVMSEEAVKGLDTLSDRFNALKLSARAFVGEFIADLLGMEESVQSISEDIAKNAEVLSLVRQYNSLKVVLGNSELASDKLAQAQKELAEVKKQLIELANGLISATMQENNEFDRQVQNLGAITASEKEMSTQELINRAIKLNDALKEQSDAQTKLDEATNKAAEAQKNLNKSAVEAGTTSEKILSGYAAQEALLGNYAMAAQNFQYANDGFVSSVEKFRKELEKSKQSVEDSEEAIAALVDEGISLDEILNLTGISVDDLNKILNNLSTEKADKVISNFKSEIDNLKASYDALKEATRQSLDATFSMWEKVDNTVINSVENLQEALDSQFEFWMNYDANLKRLEDRKIEGVDMSALIQSFTDGTQASAQALAGLALATDEEIRDIANTIKANNYIKDSLTNTIASAEEDFISKTKDLAESAIDSLTVPEQATQAATETIRAYINQVISMRDEVVSAFSSLAQAGANALNMTSSSSYNQTGYQSTSASSSTPATPQVIYVTGKVEFDGKTAGKLLLSSVEEAQANSGTNSIG